MIQSLDTQVGDIRKLTGVEDVASFSHVYF